MSVDSLLFFRFVVESRKVIGHYKCVSITAAEAEISDAFTLYNKIKFSIQGFFSKYDQIRSFLRIWSRLLKKALKENFIFCAVLDPQEHL